jgi:hypothetical protein
MGGIAGGGGKGGGSGGVSPQEAALAQYTLGQKDLQSASASANFGTPMSTMHTQADTGNVTGWAQEMAAMSDANQAAQNAQSQQSLSGLLSLAQQAGGLGGLAGGLG